ncbi:MAG: YifB family Mg chelatase-like AAA ATPase [Verrucomicrobiota bacterium]
MLSVVQSGALSGIDGLPVQIEVNTGEAGDPRLVLVGLPDAAVKESQDRVTSALSNSGFDAPRTRTTINLAPGHLRKEGPSFDLPIALGILASTSQMNGDSLSEYLIAGELSLSGETRPIRGGLSLALLARQEGKAGILLPRKTAEEAALVEGIRVFPIDSLEQAVHFLEGSATISPAIAAESPFLRRRPVEEDLDFSEIKGQHGLRRAVEIAVAGSHNLLIIGPPGSGKSMVAKRISSIMPEPTLEEYLEILRIHSVAGITRNDSQKRWFERPFRSPHHTISDVGLLGGGSIPGPGEISLAHNGVLFLDELPEFRRSTLEVLRQPLEDGEVTISRSAGKITLPASIMLVAAMNPTPDGYTGQEGRETRSTPAQIQRYRSRISGPLLDRIDIHVEAPALTLAELREEKTGETSKAIRERVVEARSVQQSRFHGTAATANATMSHRQIRTHCPLSSELGGLLQNAMEELSLSARAYDRILKVSRTIADLDQSSDIQANHLLEAIQYRSLDRNLFY